MSFKAPILDIMVGVVDMDIMDMIGTDIGLDQLVHGLSGCELPP